jgi:hypothetical protein
MSAKATLIILMVSLAVGLFWSMGVARAQDYDDYYACYAPGDYVPAYNYCDYDNGDGYYVPFGFGFGFGGDSDRDFDHGRRDGDYDRGEHRFHKGGDGGFHGGDHGGGHERH